MTSAALGEVLAAIRAVVPFYAEDRYFAPDIEAAKRLVLGGAVRRHVHALYDLRFG